MFGFEKNCWFNSHFNVNNKIQIENAAKLPKLTDLGKMIGNDNKLSGTCSMVKNRSNKFIINLCVWKQKVQYTNRQDCLILKQIKKIRTHAIRHWCAHKLVTIGWENDLQLRGDFEILICMVTYKFEYGKKYTAKYETNCFSPVLRIGCWKNTKQ